MPLSGPLPVNQCQPFPVHPSVHHRRQWIQQMAIAAAGTCFVPEVLAQPAIPWIHRSDAWKLGFRNQDQAIAGYAHGFQSSEPTLRKSLDGKKRILRPMRSAWISKLTWSIASMPVAFRGDESAFKESLATLPAAARALEKAGIERCITHIMPCHDTLTYRANFRQHQKRLRAIVSILSDHGLRFGMEYVGTQSLRNRRKFLVHTLEGLGGRCHRIGSSRPGAGLLALAQCPRYRRRFQVAESPSSRRCGAQRRPGPHSKSRAAGRATRASCFDRVIDTKGFLEGLVRIGVQAPLMAEPFNQTFRDMPRTSIGGSMPPSKGHGFDQRQAPDPMEFSEIFQWSTLIPGSLVSSSGSLSGPLRPHGHHGSGPDRSLELLPPGQRRAGLDHRSQLHRDLRWGHTGDLFAHPRNPGLSSATLDGYQMARQGKGYRALCLDLWCSCLGGLIGVGLLMAVAPQLARLALKFSSFEYFWLALFGLSMSAVVSAGHTFHGLMAATFGMPTRR